MPRLGYKQRLLLKIGMEKGYVDSDDINKFYHKSDIKIIMNILVGLNYFEEGLDDGLKIIWKCKLYEKKE